MNANFGIVLRGVDRRSVLSALGPRMRSWGDEVIVEEGAERFSFLGLDEVEFQIYPVTKFIASRLPSSERTADLEYAWMAGPGLDKYQQWAIQESITAPYGSFESSLVALLSKLGFWAVMFAPESDRLTTFAAVTPGQMIQMLRGAVRDVISSNGFLAIAKDFVAPIGE